jgi:GT2 family glycosyltransferase
LFISLIELLGLLFLGKRSAVPYSRTPLPMWHKLGLLRDLRKSTQTNRKVAYTLLAFAWVCRELKGFKPCLEQAFTGDQMALNLLATPSGFRELIGRFVLLLEASLKSDPAAESKAQRFFAFEILTKGSTEVKKAIASLTVFLETHGFEEIPRQDIQQVSSLTDNQRRVDSTQGGGRATSGDEKQTASNVQCEFVFHTKEPHPPLTLRADDPSLTLKLCRYLYKAKMFSAEEYYASFCDLQHTLPLDFPSHDNADAVVVVPHFETHSVLTSCLRALGPELYESKYKFKIVIADDASNQSIHSSLELPESVTVLQYATNVGFLRNANRAVGQTTEPIVILLNNDCIVLPGWGDELLGEMEKHPGSQIIGSKMLYPDGSILEAGGAILKDGSVVNLGRGERDGHPLFTWSREVDFVSGASLAIRREFWDQVGGFDILYSDAYCEDVDICMQARQKGGGVRLAAESKVVHLESQTYGLVRNIGESKRQNTAKLEQKWRSTLELNHLSAPADSLSLVLQGQRRQPTSKKSSHKNIILFSPFATYPLSHGNRMRTWQIGQALLERGHLVHFVLFDQEGTAEDDLVHMRDQWTSLSVVSPNSSRVTNPSGIPFDGWYQEGLGEHAASLVELYGADVVICSYVFQSRLLDFIPKYVKKIIDTHDMMSDRYSMFLERNQTPEFFSCSAQDESKYLLRAEEVWSLREEESAYFSQITAGVVQTRVVPHIEKPIRGRKRPRKLHNVGLLASANNINADLVANLLHALRQEFGPALPFELKIGGEVQDLLASQGINASYVSGLEFLGFVSSLESFYGEMDCVVSPVEYGTGVNIKTVQALAQSVPLVATKFAMKGLDSHSPFHSLNDAVHVARALREILDRPNLLVEILNDGDLAYSKYVRLYEKELFKSVED